jgi:RNA polymerase sigma-70 factor (ECF subfamily)
VAGLAVEDIEDLYNRYGPGVLYRCRQLLVDEAAAWDAMHQTFVRAIRYKNSFRGETDPRGWLFSIANRVCMDEIKARSRKKLLPLEDEEDAAPASDELPSSLEDRLHQKRAVARLLALFSEKIQEVVLLRFFDELEVREISEKTGLSERTVARRLAEFLDRSRRLLEGAKS